MTHDDVGLHALTPEYRPERHGVYAQALEQAIKAGRMRNIALTGAYGTGKSSILESLKENYSHRLLVLSLSTVGFETATTPEDSNSSTSAPTNRIQQEIVKQILYRDAPARTRGSRFHRIARFDLRRAIIPALGLALLITGILFLVGWTGPLAALLPSPWGRPADHLAAFVVAVIVVLAGRWWSHDRLILDKLTAGPATVSLAAQSPSYFDQYMDEIVYYFEQSGRDVVVFEDVDRFDDVQIFETLRALNTLLNNSAQITHRRRASRRSDGTPPQVLFIYALRDSIFERLGVDGDQAQPLDAAEEEVRRANRTKFFDLVIPVVPFITHRNARDVMSQVFSGTGVTQEIIALAAGHVADNRLILNMRNEYAIYASRLLNTAQALPGLGPDELLALLLYKSVHMADFEAIRIGRSKLDELHAAWRTLVDFSLAAAADRLHHATELLASDKAADARAEVLGRRLEELHSALWSPQGYRLVVTVGNQQFTGQQLSDRQLWQAIAHSEAPIVLSDSSYGQQSFSPMQLETLLGTELNIRTLTDRETRRREREQQRSQTETAFLRHHTWKEIYQHRTFTADLGAGRPESFAEAAERLLHSRLAQDLVANGYLNDYFGLYISEYYETQLRLDALNFVMHALDRGRADISYPLDADDVTAILRDRGDSFLQDRTAYNTSILDHLLATGDARAETVIATASAWSPEDQDFVARYLTSGTQQRALVRHLAPALPQLLSYLVTAAPVSDALRPILVDEALSHRGEDDDHAEDAELRSFVLATYPLFPSLTEDGDEDATAATTSQLAAAGIELPDITPLTLQARSASKGLGTYEVNERNLTTFTGTSSIALEDLAIVDIAIYQTALARIGDYLDAVRTSHPRLVTVAEPGQFSEVLNDVDDARARSDVSSLGEVVRLAAADCRVGVLSDVPPGAWAALCDDGRCDVSAENVLAYIDVHGHVDAHMAALISEATELAGGATLEAPDLRRLAVAVLGSVSALPSPQQRVRLTQSLGLEDPLELEDVTPESGELVGLLLQAGLLMDDEALFRSGLISDWATRERAIQESASFLSFWTPGILPVEDVHAFFESSIILDTVKDDVLLHLTAYAADPSPQWAGAAAGAARYALRRGTALSADQLSSLRAGAVAAPTMVALLAAAPDLAAHHLRDVLRTLGGDYARVADPGRWRPSFPDDASHRSVLQRLVEVGVLVSFAPHHGKLRVSLRRS